MESGDVEELVDEGEEAACMVSYDFGFSADDVGSFGLFFHGTCSLSYDTKGGAELVGYVGKEGVFCFLNVSLYALLAAAEPEVPRKESEGEDGNTDNDEKDNVVFFFCITFANVVGTCSSEVIFLSLSGNVEADVLDSVESLEVDNAVGPGIGDEVTFEC